MADEDAAQVELIAHTLKSASANVGASRLSELFRKHQQDAAAGAVPEDAVSKVRTEFEEVSLALEESVGPGSDGQAGNLIENKVASTTSI